VLEVLWSAQFFFASYREATVGFHYSHEEDLSQWLEEVK
jgi:hypothetical protein